MPVWMKDGAGEAEGTDPPESPAETVFRLYKNAMFSIARDILGDDWSAEDAVMDAVEKLCARPDALDGLDERRRRLLVMRITENAALDRWRKRKRRAAREILAPADNGDEDGGWPDEATDGLTGGLTDGLSAEEAYFLAEDFGSLEEAVAGLPEKYRDPVRLRYGEGLTNGECAEALGIAASTVSTRLERARAMLRKWIDAQKTKGENL